MADESDIAGVIIQNEAGEFLLVQETNPRFRGLWGFPGGHIDEGETPQQAAIREAREEVDVEVELLDPEHPLMFDLQDSGLKYYAYRARIKSGEPRNDPKEIMDFKWASLEEILRMADDSKTRDPMILKSIQATAIL